MKHKSEIFFKHKHDQINIHKKTQEKINHLKGLQDDSWLKETLLSVVSIVPPSMKQF